MAMMQMNLLYEKLPDTVNVGGTAYAVHTDFREWIAFFDMMADEDYRPKEKLMTSLRWFREEPPPDLLGAWNALLQFASCEAAPSGEEPNSSRRETPCFSWSHDSAYVLGAFQQCYHLDLRAVPYLHWYHFMALFEALPDDLPLKKRIGYRSVRLSDIKDPARRAEIQKIKKRIEIPHAPMSAGQVGAFF